MAQINIQNDEIPKLIHLVEQMFPGVKLDAMDNMLKDLVLSGSLNIVKKIGTETLQVALTVK